MQGRRDEKWHETPVAAHLRTRIAELSGGKEFRLPEVSFNELFRCYGLGDHPRLRRALYAKLELAYLASPGPVSRIVWNTVRRSKQKRDPARWFAVVVIDDLERADLLPTGDGSSGDPVS